MPFPQIVGFSGNITRPSKTRGLVEHVADAVAARSGQQAVVYDIEDLGPSLAAARSLPDLDERASDIVEQVIAADLLVIGSPTYKGSYTGLFKHFFDLLDPGSLKGKPLLLTATGGGERHSLMIEHQLRPLFGFFEALTLPTAIYASHRDLADAVSEAASGRISDALAQADAYLTVQAKYPPSATTPAKPRLVTAFGQRTHA